MEEVDETNENEDADKENITDHPDMELDSTETTDDSVEKKNNDISEEFPSISGVNKIDDNSAEPLEEVDTYTLLSRDLYYFYHSICNYFCDY